MKTHKNTKWREQNNLYDLKYCTQNEITLFLFIKLQRQKKITICFDFNAEKHYFSV